MPRGHNKDRFQIIGYIAVLMVSFMLSWHILSGLLEKL